MKKLALAALAVAITSTSAFAGGNCTLNRGTVFSSGPLYGQMVVKCGSTLIGTRADLTAAGVDIWQPDEVLQYARATGVMADLPEFGGEGRRPGPDGILNTADDILDGPDNSW